MSSYLRLKKNNSVINYSCFEELLSIWHNKSNNGKIITKNLLSDCFLPDTPDMESIISFFIKNQNLLRNDVNSFEDKYEKFCHNYKIRGGEIGLAKYPKHLGRAVEKEDFINYLMKKYIKLFHDRDTCENFIFRMQVDDVLLDTEKEIFMAEFGTWVTWNEKNPEEEPFEFINYDEADEVRANLGLDQHRIGNPLILFVYQPIIGLKLHKPTFTDAGVFEYFDTTILGKSPYGLTRNWPVNKENERYTIKPRPEAIHKPIIKAGVVNLKKILF